MFKYLLIITLSINILYAKADYIEASGFGNTKNEALKSAFSDAVSQYIGVVIDSKSVVKNGKLIEDKILTFSNGYIKNYKVISSHHKVGLWQITINALVKKQDVINKIIKEKISSKDIKHSNQRYAKLVSQIKTKFEAEDMFVSIMKKLLTWDTIKQYNQPKITEFFIDEDGATRKYVPVRIKINKVLNKLVYNNIKDELTSFFKKIGGKKYKNYPKYNLTTIEIDNLINGVTEYWKFPNSYKVIYPFISKNYENEWYAYFKDGEDYTIVADYANFTKYYTINFLNKKGEVLKTIKESCTLRRGGYDTIFNYGARINTFGNNGDLVYKKIVKVPLNLIKDLSRVEVKWVD